MKFKLKSAYKPAGDQPEAIKKLIDGYSKYPEQVLLGVTGSGKTFTMANVIQAVQKPTLVLAHNKTLAGQLYEEFKEFFPDNKVCYFISYYDYYQPESYLPATDTYIEKDMSINERIEEYRSEAIAALTSAEDVIVVASVSCIYGLGSPEEYKAGTVTIKKGQKLDRDAFLQELVRIGYDRNDVELKSGRFRAKGNTVDFIQGYGRDMYRVEFGTETIESIKLVDVLNNTVVEELKLALVFPATPFMISPESKECALAAIQIELQEQLPKLGPIEAHRLEKRTKHDVELIREIGHCKGIENYSRHFDGRAPGQPPQTLLDFFPDDFLMFIDESHQSIPQVRGMQNGDYARKKNLVENGFRLPSAYDNRPLTFDEFEDYLKHVIYVSATPGDYEMKHAKQLAEQIIRPTGLIDPEIFVRPSKGQIEDLLGEIKSVKEKGNRVLITTLTKRMAEDLTDFLIQKDVKVNYLHSEVDTLERAEIIADLRRGTYDVLVGINLLREGLDLPEVGLVAILDADKESFLRDERSLIQTIGRAARNVDSYVLMYADKITGSMKAAMKETERRRAKQIAYNTAHKITPQTIIKKVKAKKEVIKEEIELFGLDKKLGSLDEVIIEMEAQMQTAAENLDFERAIKLRDEVKRLRGV